ncbi:hypothetical protein VEL88_002269, partial [Cronobacter sakazakii]|nr:hypothetical protein [Cronobacter sakazakii]
MRPLYQQLKMNHYSSTDGSADFVDARDVYAEIGYDYDDIIKVNQAFKNTCAVRMSLALLKCNVPFDGRFIIKAGAYKGRKI